MDPAELFTLALQNPRDSAERIMYALAGLALITEGRLVAVGGAAQVTHTGTPRATDLDVVGVLTRTDQDRLRAAGFRRDGRHWLLEKDGAAIAIEIPSASLDAEEAPEIIDIEGVGVPIISVTDLMMDRLVQATDGTATTRDEANQLAIAAFDRIDWNRIKKRAKKRAKDEPLQHELPVLVNAIRKYASSVQVN